MLLDKPETVQNTIIFTREPQFVRTDITDNRSINRISTREQQEQLVG